MKLTYKKKQKNNYLNDNDNEIWRGFTTMIPAHKHPYLILQATKRMPVAQVQWPSTVKTRDYLRPRHENFKDPVALVVYCLWKVQAIWKSLKIFKRTSPFHPSFLKMTPIAMETTNILATNLVEVRHRESNLHERPPLVSDHLP